MPKKGDSFTIDDRNGDKVSVTFDGENWCVFDNDLPVGRMPAFEPADAEWVMNAIIRNYDKGFSKGYSDGVGDVKRILHELVLTDDFTQMKKETP